MKAIILAAAPAERLHPYTETRARPMIHAAGKPMLEETTRSLKAAGINEVVIVVNHQQETVRSYFGHGHEFGLSINYVEQEPLDGIGGAVKRCEAAIGQEEFLLVYGDALATGLVFESLMAQHVEAGGASAALYLPPSSSAYGNVYLDQDMKIVQLVEKPTDRHLSNYVFAGIFVLPHSFFQLLKTHGNDIEACYQHMIGKGELSGAIWEGEWLDVRHPWDILEANRMLMRCWSEARIHAKARLETNVHIQGAVHIEPDVVISAGSVLKGPCYIGAGSYIGHNALIREYTALGPQSVVGYGSELKNCVFFGGSTLGRLSYIGDSVIGEGTHLGTGVTTVNYEAADKEIILDTPEGPLPTGVNKLGAFIGDRVHIGARQVLAAGTCIKTGTVVESLITLRSTK